MVSQSILVLNKLLIVSLSVRIVQPSFHIPSDAGVTSPSSVRTAGVSPNLIQGWSTMMQYCLIAGSEIHSLTILF